MANLFKVFNVTSQKEFDNLMEQTDIDMFNGSNIFEIVEMYDDVNVCRKNILETVALNDYNNYVILKKQFEKKPFVRKLKEEWGVDRHNGDIYLKNPTSKELSEFLKDSYKSSMIEKRTIARAILIAETDDLYVFSGWNYTHDMFKQSIGINDESIDFALSVDKKAYGNLPKGHFSSKDYDYMINSNSVHEAGIKLPNGNVMLRETEESFIADDAYDDMAEDKNSNDITEEEAKIRMQELVDALQNEAKHHKSVNLIRLYRKTTNDNGKLISENIDKRINNVINEWSNNVYGPISYRLSMNKKLALIENDNEYSKKILNILEEYK